jgi:hypothetical protein
VKIRSGSGVIVLRSNDLGEAAWDCTDENDKQARRAILCRILYNAKWHLTAGPSEWDIDRLRNFK